MGARRGRIAKRPNRPMEAQFRTETTDGRQKRSIVEGGVFFGLSPFGGKGRGIEGEGLGCARDGDSTCEEPPSPQPSPPKLGGEGVIDVCLEDRKARR